jgi:hypothetical protein
MSGRLDAKDAELDPRANKIVFDKYLGPISNKRDKPLGTSHSIIKSVMRPPKRVSLYL